MKKVSKDVVVKDGQRKTVMKYFGEGENPDRQGGVVAGMPIGATDVMLQAAASASDKLSGLMSRQFGT